MMIGHVGVLFYLPKIFCKGQSISTLYVLETISIFFYLATILISVIRKLLFLRVWIVLNDIHRFIRKNLPTKLAAEWIYL